MIPFMYLTTGVRLIGVLLYFLLSLLYGQCTNIRNAQVQKFGGVAQSRLQTEGLGNRDSIPTERRSFPLHKCARNGSKPYPTLLTVGLLSRREGGRDVKLTTYLSQVL